MQKTIARITLTAATALASAAALLNGPAASAAPAPETTTPAPRATAAAAPQTGIFGETVAPAQAPASVAAIPALPIMGGAPVSGYYVSNATKVLWFNYLLREIDPGRKGNWVLDLYGTKTSYYNRGNTYPTSYGKARPTVYIYGVGQWDTTRMRNVMWHERTHVLQTYDVGYSRAMYILGGTKGMEATAVCTEHLKGLARPGWGCSSYDMNRTKALWAGTLR